MSSAQVIEVLDHLDAAEVPVWLDGGWGVDALVGEHGHDLALLAARFELPLPPTLGDR